MGVAYRESATIDRRYQRSPVEDTGVKNQAGRGVAPRTRGTNRDLWAQVAFYSSLGFIIPGAAAAGYFIGWFLDQYLHTGPALSIVGGVAGLASGIIEIIQLLTRMEKNADRNDSESGER